MSKSEGRPSKNSDGQKKKPSANPDGGSKPGAPAAPQRGPDPAAAGSGATPSLVPAGAFAPSPMKSQSDARTNTNFKDLPPLGQAQAMEQMGLDPAAGNKMAQGAVQNAAMQPPVDAMGVPNAMSGPGIDPELAGMPADMMALHAKLGPLQQTMAQGFAPGSSNMEHEVGLNAAALARAHASVAVGKAQGQIEASQTRMQLGGLLQKLLATGSAPPPDEMAQHVSSMQPQLQSGSY